jgi:hypothetical protein
MLRCSNFFVMRILQGSPFPLRRPRRFCSTEHDHSPLSFGMIAVGQKPMNKPLS